jgi:hypothetical protein
VSSIQDTATKAIEAVRKRADAEMTRVTSGRR